MNILPIFDEQAQRKHWVVRWLRNMGHFICFLAGVSGVFGALSLFAPFANDMSSQGALIVFDVLVAILGCCVGALAGCIIGLPYWGLAMLLDDLHALRVYASGYYAVQDQEDDEDDEDDEEGDAP